MFRRKMMASFLTFCILFGVMILVSCECPGEHFSFFNLYTFPVCFCVTKVFLLTLTVQLKVYLTPKFFFPLKRMYLLFEIVLRKNFWIPWNPRFSVPRRNLENSSKTPFEENGSSGSCDVYPGRFDISRPLISFRILQYTFEKCAETPSRGAIGCCSNIPDLKKDILYNLLTMIG